MKRYILSLAIICFLAGNAYSQTSYASLPSQYYTFSWNIAFPLGDFSEYWVEDPSLTGFDFGARYNVNDVIMAGFNIGSQRINQLHENTTYSLPDKGIAITADNYRITWMVPFQAVIAKHFLQDGKVSPYIGLGIGGDYMQHHLVIQEYDIYKEQWDFSLSPEIGALVRLGSYGQWGILAAFNYKWTTNKIEVYEESIDNLSMLNLKIGFVYIVE